MLKRVGGTFSSDRFKKKKRCVHWHFDRIRSVKIPLRVYVNGFSLDARHSLESFLLLLFLSGYSVDSRAPRRCIFRRISPPYWRYVRFNSYKRRFRCGRDGRTRKKAPSEDNNIFLGHKMKIRKNFFSECFIDQKLRTGRSGRAGPVWD